MSYTHKASAITTSIALGLFSMVAIPPAKAATPSTSNSATTEQIPIKASELVPASFERPAVASVAAAPQAPTQPVVQSSPVVAAPAIATPAKAQTPAVQTLPQPTSAPVVPTATAPAPVVPEPAPKPNAARGAIIAAAALAQLGRAQDCTALVSNAIAAVGINFHGWPAGYKSLGHIVSAAEAQAGDLIYYDNAGAGVPHIAVYIGNGQAVHGGWNGGTTAVYSAFIGSGQTFIRI